MKNRTALLIATILLLCIVSQYAHGQENRTFSGDVALFPKELNDFISGKTDAESDFLKQFGAFWVTDSIDFDKKENIIEMANLMLPVLTENKGPLLRYVGVIATFFRNNYAMQQYPIWYKAANMVLNDEDFSLIKLIDFIRFTENTINRSIMNSTNSFAWKSSVHPSYNFDFTNELSVRYNSINLTCIYKSDSIFIKNTSGTYNPRTKMWHGRGGKITWIRSEYPENEIFVEINRPYRIDLTKNSFTIDSVLFTNKDYFTSPNLGTVTDKLLKDYHKNTIQYPEFHSYDKWFNIKNLFNNIDYEGGYVMRGSQLIGTGSRDKLATIVIRRNNKEFMRAEGNILIFQRSILNTDKASVTIRIGSDSLYHVGLGFNYNNKTRTVTISPTDKLTTQSPIRSSYHKMSIWFNQLSWNIESSKIIFSATTGSATGIAQFESDNFFNEELFDDMIGPNDRHPLFAIWAYANQVNSRDFLAADIAVYLRKPIEHVKIEMMRIAKQGYILYDFTTDEVSLTDKLYNAIQARHRKIDYDVIKFNSRCDGRTPNAVLNIDSLNMQINGIDYISVSQTQNVHIDPKNKTIVMKKNRDFSFAGNLQAGLFKFYGDNFFFNYDKFQIDLKDVDIVQLDYQEKDYDTYGRRLLSTVTSTLEQITGNILIDKPHNKSGLMKNPEYPIFNSTQNSFVYYDSPKTFGGIYRRDSIYFEIDPFTYKNLNNFEKTDMVFKGTFFSKNILAPIEESLVLRPDNSLGFVHQTPSEGFAVYQGKGRTYNLIDVSDRGIFANGKITYITSTTTSEEMFLFPDSMKTISNEFTIQKRTSGIEFPNVSAKKHRIKWLPKSDRLYAYKGNEPFTMYDEEAKLNGNLLLAPLGLTGNGSITLQAAQMNSNMYEFAANNYSSPSVNLKLFNPTSMELAFASNDIKTHIDFTEQSGTFKKNGQSIFANLAPLKYEAHLDQFGWNMTSGELTLLTAKKQDFIEASRFYTRNMHKKDTALNGSLFYSVQFNEDSLYFISPKAIYSTKEANLKASKVEHIISADAMIIPNEQEVEVSAKQRLHPLKNAVVNASIDSMFHRLYNAEIVIQGQKKYKGKGDYDYIDERDSVQTVHFAQIKVDTSLNTVAETEIAQPDSFTLSPNFGYFGNVKLYAPNKLLTFKGFAKPFYSCSGSTAQWFNFETSIDPKNILIPVEDKARSNHLAFLINGSVVREDTIKLYGGFFQKRYDYADKPITQASGFLTFNKLNRRFVIAPLHKIMNPDTSGNSVSLQKDYCYLFGDGGINLPVNLGQVKIAGNGNIIHKMEQNAITIDMVAKLNFHFNQAALELIATEINQSVALPKVDLSRKTFRKALYNMVDNAQLPKILGKINQTGTFEEIPKGYESTITFADIKLTWDPVRRSFISTGKLGIGTIGNIQVNRYIDGYIEIFKKRSGDVFNLYLNLGDDKYYGFVYTKSTMQVVSSNQAFLAIINQLKSKDTRLKTKPGEPAYKFLVGTQKEIEIIKSRFRELKP